MNTRPSRELMQNKQGTLQAGRTCCAMHEDARPKQCGTAEEGMVLADRSSVARLSFFGIFRVVEQVLEGVFHHLAVHNRD